jgi:hypothetical protein
MAHNATFLIEKAPTHQTFMIARATSIEQYANIEQALVALCAHLMGVTVDVAGVPFFQMNNARARLIMLERLLKKRHGSEFNVFWNSLQKQLREMDNTRNQIVHWITEKTVTSDNESWTCLVGANYWDRTENSPKLRLDDLYDFILKCDFIYHLLQHFTWVISKSSKMIHPTWPAICHEEVVYPPPETHPLFRKWQ